MRCVRQQSGAHLFAVVAHLVSICGKGQNRAVVARTALA